MKRSAKTYALTVVILLMFLLAFSACGLHNCSFDNWETIQEATHTTTGLKKATCFCGESKVEAIPKTEEHAYGAWTVSKESTCSEEGLKVRVCICNHVESLVIPALHSNLDEALVVTEDATCEKDGAKKHVCKVCEETICEEIIPATGHKAQSEWVVNVAAGCETSGIKHLHCETCETLLETQVIPATGHTYDVKNDGWVLNDDNDCTTDDTKTRVCTTCDATESEIVPASHRWEHVGTITPAACTTDGLERSVCALCGVEETVSIPATGHNYCKITTAATCIEGGNEKSECSNCGNVCEMKLIPATGHYFVEVVDVDATCSTTGSKHQECKVCQALLAESQEEIPVIAHTFGKWNLVSDATCTADGSQVRFCSSCGEPETEILAKVDHVYDWSYACDEDAPTCTADGNLSWMCACGDIQGYKAVAALGHDMGEAQITVPPSCTEDGTSVQCCQREGCNHEEETTIEAAHTWLTEQVKLAPTCYAEGEAIQLCANCDEKNYIVLEKTEHSMAWIEKTAQITGSTIVWVDSKATCTNSGFATYKCTECDYYIGDSKVTAKLPHTPAKEWEVDEDPTCTKDGRTHLSCSECNTEIESKLLPATGHIDINWVDDNTAGISSYVCTCGKEFDKMSIGLVIEGDTLVSIGSCTSSVVYVPATVTKIAAGAFDSATFTAIYLPAGLIEIGENAFRDCTALTDIHFDGSTADWNAVDKQANWDKNTGNYTVY